jgi:molybdopterin-guanine dinucleotide biosynthesis protein A
MVFADGRAPSPAGAEEQGKIRPMSVRESICGLILAGGASQRFGGRDKGLQILAGRALVDHVLERLAPQVSQVLLSANRNTFAYERAGVRVLADLALGLGEGPPPPGEQGPLGGLRAAWAATTHSWIALCPVDAPLLAPDLVSRLASARQGSDTAVVCRTREGPEPLFALVHRSTEPALVQRLMVGERAAQGFWRAVGARELDCSDIAESFANVNTPQALAEMEARLAARPAQSD